MCSQKVEQKKRRFLILGAVTFLFILFIDGKHPEEDFSDYLAYFQEASGHIAQTAEKSGFHPVVVGM